MARDLALCPVWPSNRPCLCLRARCRVCSGRRAMRLRRQPTVSRHQSINMAWRCEELDSTAQQPPRRPYSTMPACFSAKPVPVVWGRLATGMVIIQVVCKSVSSHICWPYHRRLVASHHIAAGDLSYPYPDAVHLPFLLSSSNLFSLFCFFLDTIRQPH